MIDSLEKWDRRFLKLAKEVSTWSKDPSTKVGAVVVDGHTKEIISLGYNGFPRGMGDYESYYNNRELKYAMVVHAEENAIISGLNKIKHSYSVLYVYPSFMLPPICSRCCATAIQAGINEIVGFYNDELDEQQLRWKDSILISKQMCDSVGISYRGLKE